MIYYFSGTGNSLWVAKELGKLLQMQVENLIKCKEAPLVCQNGVMGFVFPTYMGDIPWIVKEILLEAKIDEIDYIFLVMTSNNGESRSSFASVDEILYRRGNHLSAGFNLQMPGNCLISSEKENRLRLETAPTTVKKISTIIQKKENNYRSLGKKANTGIVEKSYFYGTHSLIRLTFMKNFRVMKNCTGCGFCMDVCPTGNISIKDGKVMYGKRCAACYACLHWCPQNAIKLKVPILRNRPQYHHPEISIHDIKK